ncbi:hypothetical protein Sjap_024837 [Stephania japonica]|uniref:Uncharacterized protein n=1 Tax=Stephania japonica TaxID=461633 RepID=A0AAP0EE33_9MAGN
MPVLTFPETSGQVVNVPAKIAPMPECKRPKLEPACEANTTNVSQNITSLSVQCFPVQAVEATDTQSSYVDATVRQKRSRKKNKKSRNILPNSDQPLGTHNQDSILAST